VTVARDKLLYGWRNDLRRAFVDGLIA